MKIDFSDKELMIQLAASMVSPIRCGGLHYDEHDRPYYLVGGKRLSPDEFRALKR